ncbi:heat shock transcription factor, X-linked member 3-like [Bos javanicus]|jgi:hypothetical protein|uniref:heat shock transcription factor, X-linked member 3-like n=1 Tax=Bos javanicus TaxID=9906 RepID=UPI002AA69933|nr:heat shock transcription factor, X-linked member 3-like [Bos javanicus]XP_061264685.1 heat shock transcription factor, X-linked member 3-like [Bos javanicus]
MRSPAGPINWWRGHSRSPQIQTWIQGRLWRSYGTNLKVQIWAPNNPPRQGLNPETANEEENNAFLRLSFPRKLWMIMENAAFTPVHWNDEGDTVVIKADLFQTEVFQHRGADRIFETDSIKTFIHKLNLYVQ